MKALLSFILSIPLLLANTIDSVSRKPRAPKALVPVPVSRKRNTWIYPAGFIFAKPEVYAECITTADEVSCAVAFDGEVIYTLCVWGFAIIFAILAYMFISKELTVK